MTVEIIVASAAVVGVVITGYAQIRTWRKNGQEQRERDLEIARNQAVRDTAINATQKNILAKLEDDNTGLSAINAKVNDMVNHCSTVSTEYGQRIITAERDIKELKSKRNKAP